MLEQIKAGARAALGELLEKAGLQEGELVVIGCSTSEIAGGDIGHASSPEIGAAVYAAISEILSERGLYAAAQCCEHLNRAVIIEREAAKARGYELVNAVPQTNAGGSFATAAYRAMRDPVTAEEIRADAGLDIGGTLIGMQLRRVAVPVKLKNNKIGAANVTAARTRLKFIGGKRTTYK
ncbi:MAG: TIGR01440 family protein [Oscillospiraceae bacterium]|jgi:uncharacterized protein (TIGR01440 family)|nr:TIGR01440 family protein [Oscillospiraceae bacterium]